MMNILSLIYTKLDSISSLTKTHYVTKKRPSMQEKLLEAFRNPTQGFVIPKS